MKRILYIVAAAMPLLWGCQTEMDVTEGTEAVASFRVSLPQAAQTKSVGDGENVDILYYEIWSDNEGSIGSKLNSGSVARTAVKEFDLNVTLLSDQTYHFLFWAQVEACKAYDVTSLRSVTTSYANVAGNDESRAAFFAAVPVTMNGDQEVGVTLYRPFAQLNIGTLTYKSDMTPNDVEVKSTVVTVKTPADCFDVATGKGSTTAAADAVFAAEGVVTDPATFRVKDPVTSVETDYHYLSMNYFFVDGDYYALEGDTVEVELDIITDFGTVKRSVPNVPVRGNWKTNIAGDLLFKTADFNIIVEESFVTEPGYVL